MCQTILSEFLWQSDRLLLAYAYVLSPFVLQYPHHPALLLFVTCARCRQAETYPLCDSSDSGYHWFLIYCAFLWIGIRVSVHMCVLVQNHFFALQSSALQFASAELSANLLSVS